jgi:hypothetical protein
MNKLMAMLLALLVSFSGMSLAQKKEGDKSKTPQDANKMAVERLNPGASMVDATGKDEAKTKGLSKFSNFSAQPRYLPTAVLGRWIKTVGEYSPYYLNNFVVLNEALFLDYNRYDNPEIAAAINALTENFQFDREMVYRYLVPDVYQLKANGLNVNDYYENMMQLHFAGMPDVVKFIPPAILEELKSPQSINNFIRK